jgi:hypothetical protein
VKHLSLTIAVLLPAVTSLTGCATVRTTPYLERTESAGDSLPGLTYSLPMAQYDLVVVRTLSECPGGQTNGEATQLKFSIDVGGAERYVPGEAYTLDSRLVGFLKTSSLELNYYASGTLKSIGVQAEDKTGEVIANTAKIAAAGLILASGSPAIAAAVAPALAASDSKAYTTRAKGMITTTKAPLQLVCTDEAVANVEAFTKADQALKDEAEKLREANQRLKTLTDEITLKVKRPTDRKVKAEWAAIIADQIRADVAIRTAEKEKTRLIEVLSVSQTYRWPRDFTDARSNPLLETNSAALAKLRKLVELDTPERLDPLTAQDALQSANDLLARKAVPSKPDGRVIAKAELADMLSLVASPTGPAPKLPKSCLGAAANVDQCLLYHLNLRGSPLDDWSLGTPCDADRRPAGCVIVRKPSDVRVQHARNDAYDEGIFIREPMQGVLVICRDYKAVAGVCDRQQDIAKFAPINFPQLGQLRFLKFKVPPFQAKDMGIFLAEDGRLQRYYLKSTKAAGEALTASVASAANEIGTALEKRETERRDDLAYAQGTTSRELAAQIAEIENRNKRKTLLTEPTPDPLAPIREAAAEDAVHVARLEQQLTRRQLETAIGTGDDAAARALLGILRK